MFDNYSNILVAMDGSKNSELALQYGVAIAKEKNATLYLLSVVDENAISHSSYAYSKVLAEEKEAIEKELLKNIYYATQEGLNDVIPIVEIGNPKEMISTVVPRDQAIDLIIVGSTGKGMIQSNQLGTTTSYVVQYAPCNVLVVK
ncbi:universal stress protein [Enterococcus quebecensis]|uniref:Universal stress protein UspA n=1 Tax=Enterococcus quebecensis TaxID=903983 RepID=A0A1E5H2X9_9ENTE|nr:universal stress protein [Enterococcus quebecensis]OEG19266.1 universal stress protein UspA [Enterococcus quebecensis]